MARFQSLNVFDLLATEDEELDFLKSPLVSEPAVELGEEISEDQLQDFQTVEKKERIFSEAKGTAKDSTECEESLFQPHADEECEEFSEEYSERFSIITMKGGKKCKNGKGQKQTLKGGKSRK